MVTIQNSLKITLKSDLCVGSGFSYAGIIDSDVSYDKYGVPFISGRRLKGCMRDAAAMIKVSGEQIRRIFGVSGDNGTYGVTIGNGFPVGWKKKERAIQCLQENFSGAAQYLSPENVLAQFTMVQAQTRIGDEGVAQDGSLRFTRVVRKNDFARKEGALVFEAPITYTCREEEREQLEEQLCRILKATRHIGLKRNRGLGNVQIKLGTGQEFHSEINVKRLDKEAVSRESEGERVGIHYVIQNHEPLKMSSDDIRGSVTYIGGASVLGAIAAQYLKNGTAEDEAFEALFLDGEVCYSDLMPVQKIGGEYLIYYPAPQYINRMKKTKKLVNVLCDATKEQEERYKTEVAYHLENGNQPKKLKGKYVACKNQKYAVHEVDMEMVYHHNTKDKSKDRPNGLLYSEEVIEEGQFFGGVIWTERKWLNLVLKLLTEADLCFGKSKGAQYGHCHIVGDIEVRNLESQSEKHRTFLKEHRVVVTLLSDAAFMDEEGNYTVQNKKVRQQIANQLGITDKKPEVGEGYTGDYIQTKERNGYNTKWNFRKQSVPVIAAGSAFCFILEEDLKEYPEYVGERNVEGLGRISITDTEEFCYCIDELESELNLSTKKEKQTGSSEEIHDVVAEVHQELEEVEPQLKVILQEKLYQRMQKQWYEKVQDSSKAEKLKVSPATLGRVKLMLTEAINECRNQENEAEKIYFNLRKRIQSFKRGEVREELYGFLAKIFGKEAFKERQQRNREDWNESLDGIETDAKIIKESIVRHLVQSKDKALAGTGSSEKVYKEYTDLCEWYGEETAQELVYELWYRYLQELLVLQKYLMKDEEMTEDK